MDFCDECENLLNLRINPEKVGKDQLELFCNKCGNVKKVDYKKNSCIVKNTYNLKDIFIHDKNIEYVCQDPTLPHVNNLDCPNRECLSYKKGETKDVVYIEILENDMKYSYICCKCKTTWTNE